MLKVLAIVDSTREIPGGKIKVSGILSWPLRALSDEDENDPSSINLSRNCQ
jgi:hypothetical protein